MLKTQFLLLLLFPVVCFGQLKITGKIINLHDKKAIANASVFLNNASIGNKTTEDGSFILSNVRPGQYDLIVSIIGFETYSKTVLLTNSNINIPEIGLIPKTIELNEVKIKPDPNWEKYYRQFKLQFLGSSANAKECKILNPDMLDLGYNKRTHELEASSFDFLEIENKTLGYKIRYKLNKFSYKAADGTVFYQGISLFQNLKGSSRNLRQWKKRRMLAYLGSPMHFLRGIISNQLLPEGFDVYKLIRKPNPAYHDESDSKYLQTLVEKSLPLSDFTKRTDQPGLFALGYSDCLYIMYIKKHDDSTDLSVYHPSSIPDYAISVATFNEPYAFFDHNGIIRNPHSVVFEGNWGTYRIAELLPVDFEPEDTK